MCSQQESNCNGCTPRCRCACDPPSFNCQESDDKEAPYSNQEQQSTQGHRHLSLHIETRTVHFKDNQHESKDKELEDLIFQLHDLPVQDCAYTSIYVQCQRRFPDTIRGVPQPQYQTDTSASYLYQTTNPPSPTLQLWSQPSVSPPLTLQQWSTPATAPTPSANTIPTATYSTSTLDLNLRPAPFIMLKVTTSAHVLLQTSISSPDEPPMSMTASTMANQFPLTVLNKNLREVLTLGLLHRAHPHWHQPRSTLSSCRSSLPTLLHTRPQPAGLRKW